MLSLFVCKCGTIESSNHQWSEHPTPFLTKMLELHAKTIANVNPLKCLGKAIHENLNP